MGMKQILGWGAVAAFGGLVFIDRFTNLAENESNACFEAKQAVEYHLTAPATAAFSSCTYRDAVKQADGTWRVEGTVDAQNAFGAKIRSVFIVRLRYTGRDTWRVENVALL